MLRMNLLRPNNTLASTCISIHSRGLAFSLLLLGSPAGQAATLTDISFISNNSSFVNDTILNFASPLAFTTTMGLDQPFLNDSNSTISLGYGEYYAITFLGFGSHVGNGQVSFRVDGGPLITENVVFPDPTLSDIVFANILLPGGDTVTISTTGLSADRIRILADGGGLQADGTLDAFYRFTYIPEPSVCSFLPLAMLLAARRRR